MKRVEKPKICDPFDPAFADWFMCDLADMKRLFGNACRYKSGPEGGPEPWFLFGHPFWRLCEVRKWVRDLGGVQAAREER